jgi:hypothetical protein
VRRRVHACSQAAQPAAAPLQPHAALQPALLPQAPPAPSRARAAAGTARGGAAASRAVAAPDARRPAAPRRPRAPPAPQDVVLCRVPGCAVVVERTYHKRIRYENTHPNDQTPLFISSLVALTLRAACAFIFPPQPLC